VDCGKVLISGTRSGKRRAHYHRGGNARPTNLADDKGGRWIDLTNGQPERACEPGKQIAYGDRIGADREG
jgi:hypothetical protein